MKELSSLVYKNRNLYFQNIVWKRVLNISRKILKIKCKTLIFFNNKLENLCKVQKIDYHSIFFLTVIKLNFLFVWISFFCWRFHVLFFGVMETGFGMTWRIFGWRVESFRSIAPISTIIKFPGISTTLHHWPLFICL